MSDDEKISAILRSMKRIAVVGLSRNPDRPSHDVARYLQHAGFEIVPVNPAESGEILGQAVYRDLASVPGDIDVVDVFRRPDAVLPIAEDVVRRGGVRAFWMQLGISSPPARALLERHGISVVEDRCLKVEHQRSR
ncbi:MAG: CoA-binding protein [Deltaproteobacteria bacterium]|nr:CoA-binding protein [Deltaproteobacteria bacterium]